MTRYRTLGVFAILSISCVSAHAQSTLNPEPETVRPAAPIATPNISQPPTPAPEASAQAQSGFAFGGQVFLALQNWSKVGMSGDSKLGLGIGGSFGIGFRVDDMKLMLGPSLWSNTWSADYSQKAQSVTSRVFVTMNDAGISLSSYLDDMYLEMGGGQSTIRSGMTVGSKEIAYSYDGQSFSYKTVGIGFKSGNILCGLGFKNYDGLAKSANHLNFLIGLGF